MKKIFNIISVAFFLTVIFGFGIFTIASPQRDFSENENRYLEKFPKFSFNELFKGNYIPKLEKSISDQIPLRDRMISMRSELLEFCGNKDIGNAYIGKDDFLFEKLSDSDIFTKRFERNLGLINTFAQDFGGETNVMLLPSASGILTEKLPKYNSQYDTEKAFNEAENLLSGCGFIDTRDALKALGDDAYYKTDHHWTTMSARAAYQLWCSRFGTEYTEKPLEKLTDSFRGTLYSKVLSDKCAYDSIYAYTPPDSIKVSVNGSPSQMYDFQKLDTKDKYAVFFGGNFGRIDITNDNAEGGSLIIFKDSYANCFVPFLADDYKHITMIDLRYFSGSVKAAAKEYDSTLFLYEMSNFARDTDFVKVIM